jgi:excisionase family DNA binding protein
MEKTSKDAVSVPEMMTIRQVAKRGILPERAIRRMVADGRIKTVKSGKVRYINYGLLLAHLNSEDGEIWETEGQS